MPSAGKRGARWEVERDLPPEPLLIRDVGPWNRHPTITNDAENVVAELLRSGALEPGRRLIYRDSSGQIDELVIEDGQFVSFAPYPLGAALEDADE